MAEAVAVPVSGFTVPAIPAQAQAVAQSQPAAANMQPGFVPQGQTPPAQGFTQAQVQEQIAAALEAAKPQAPAAVAPVVPPQNFDFKSDVSDPILQSYTDVFLGIGTGVDINRAIGKALTYGDPALIDSAYLAEKGGAHAAQLATIAKAIVERVQTQTAAASASVFEAAGGKPQWDAAAAVFDKSAPQHLKLVIARLLDSGDNNAIKSAAQTVVDYVKQNGLVVNPAQLIHAGASTGDAAQALSKDEFQAAHAKLNPNSRTYLADRDALFGRRQLGKQLGR